MTSTDGPVAICAQHGEFSLHTGCLRCPDNPNYHDVDQGRDDGAFDVCSPQPQYGVEAHDFGPEHGPVPETVLFPASKATTVNPKDLFGSLKVSLSKLPAAGVIHGAHAMGDGAVKYGAYNWRDKKVIASIYVDAAERHLKSWFEGEEEAEDSGVHHLGHAIACMAIILDAQETGNLVDDRPNGGAVASRIFSRIAAKIKARKEASK